MIAVFSNYDPTMQNYAAPWIPPGEGEDKRQLEYRIPGLHSPVNSQRFPEMFGDLCTNKTGFLLVFVENHFL